MGYRPEEKCEADFNEIQGEYEQCDNKRRFDVHNLIYSLHDKVNIINNPKISNHE